MVNKYLKDIKLHKILLFILCGIVIVLFLNYNNLFFYKKSISNKTENFFTPTMQTITNITIPSTNNSQLNNPNFNYNNIYKFIRVICPSETETEINGKLFIANYNIFNCRSIDIVNNKNNALFTDIFIIKENKVEDDENVFASNLLDLRKDDSLSYASSEKIIGIPLNFEYGIEFNIEFILQFSYSINPVKIPSRIVIKEIMPSEFLIESEKLKYKTYSLDYFSLSSNPSDNNNYLLKFKLPDFNNNNKVFNQELILDLKFNNFNDSNVTYQNLINDINIFKSVMTYNIYLNNIIVFSADIKVIFNTTQLSGNLKDYTEKEIQNIFTETLNDKYNKIVTPMFLMDNNIAKQEKTINDIKSHYLLSELSNIKNNIKFFNNFN